MEVNPKKELEEVLKKQAPLSPHFRTVMTNLLSERRAPKCLVTWARALEVLQRAQVGSKLVRS